MKNKFTKEQKKVIKDTKKITEKINDLVLKIECFDLEKDATLDQKLMVLQLVSMRTYRLYLWQRMRNFY
jgi:hypothetical protein